MTTDEALARQLVDEWVGTDASLTSLQAMNSSTWFVDAGADRYVVKVTGPAGEPGLQLASSLEERGALAGAPVRFTTVDGRVVALLRFVDGRTLQPDEVTTIGRTLGEIHRLLVAARVPDGLDRWPWAWLDPQVIDETPLRIAAGVAVDRAIALAPQLTHGPLHGDPAAEAFLETADGRVALIDWGAALHGPFLYDVASAWLYSGKAPSLIDAYADAGPLEPAELVHVRDFLRFRWAVQAWYFAQRLTSGDLTGVESRADNEEGLADARDALLG